MIMVSVWTMETLEAKESLQGARIWTKAVRAVDGKERIYLKTGETNSTEKVAELTRYEDSQAFNLDV